MKKKTAGPGLPLNLRGVRVLLNKKGPPRRRLSQVTGPGFARPGVLTGKQEPSGCEFESEDIDPAS